jgi:hypothetical protein
MARFSERVIALAPAERLTLAALSDATLEPAAQRLRRAAETGAIDVTDPLIRRWLRGHRDALLGADAGDLEELALIARLLSDALDATAAEAAAAAA